MSALAAAEVDKPQQIQVYVRTRPISKTRSSFDIIQIPGSKNICVKQPYRKKYSFDKVFGPDTIQVDLYLTVVQPYIYQVLAGYNCTVFAYGQTGAGKTYTMIGERTKRTSKWVEDEKAGIIPRALAHLFDELSVQQQEHTVRVSYLELYNEELYDLLADTDDTSRIRILEDQKGSVIIQGVVEQTVLNKNDIYKILDKGQERRRTAPSVTSAKLTRSHTVFTINVHTRETTDQGEIIVKSGKLNLVDLAGSENVRKSCEVKKRVREAGSINQSLLTLGRVMTALVEGGQHIPYRESLLTKMLQDSLGGRNQTSLIANISLSSTNIEETLSTLDYANRARNITNRPVVNSHTSQKGLMSEYVNEINRLRKDLSAARTGSGVHLSQESYDRLIADNDINKEELADKIGLIQDIQERLDKLETEKAYVEWEWNNLQVSFEESKNYIKAIQAQLQDEKHLSKSYESRAFALHQEAKELMNVTKSSIENENCMHDKIKNLRKIANNNVDSMRTVIKNVCSIEKGLSEQLASHSENVSKINSNLSGLVESAHSRIPDIKELNRDVIQSILQEHQVAAGLFEGMNEAQRGNLAAFMNVVCEKYCRLVEEQVAMVKNKLTDDLFETVAQLVHTNEKRHNDFYVQLDEQVKGIAGLLANNFRSTTINIQAIARILSDDFHKMGDLLTKRQSTNQWLSTVNKDQKQIKELTSILTKAQSMLAALEKKAAATQPNINKQKYLNKQCQAMLETAKNKVETDLPPIITMMQNNVTDTIVLTKSLVNEAAEERVQQLQSNATNKELMHKLQEETASHTNSMVGKTQAFDGLLNQLTKDAKTVQQNHCDKYKSGIQTCFNRVEQLLNEKTVKEDVELTNLSSDFDIMEKELAELESCSIENREAAANTLSRTQGELYRLTCNDSLEMKRSGDTPGRAQVPTSITIKQPTPRQLILKRLQDGEATRKSPDSQDAPAKANRWLTVPESNSKYPTQTNEKD